MLLGGLSAPIDFMAKQAFTYITVAIVAALLALGAYEAWHQDWTGVFVVAQAILMSFLPYLLRRYFRIYTPFPLRVGIVFFVCSTLVLGEIADFYNMFWWWDLILHGVASVGVTLILFICLLIFFTRIDLRSAALFTSFLAMGSSLAVAVVWEIYEFLIDLHFQTDTPMQPSNLDTMTDLIVSVVGAVLVGIYGYKHIKWRSGGWLGHIIHEGARKNS